MVKLNLSRCDEVNHGGVRYPVSNSSTALGIGEVDVPAHVAAILLRTSAGAVLAEPEAPAGEPSGESMPVRHVRDRGASFSWQGQCFAPDENGIILAPAECVTQIASHGFVPTGEDQ